MVASAQFGQPGTRPLLVDTGMQNRPAAEGQAGGNGYHEQRGELASEEKGCGCYCGGKSP